MRLSPRPVIQISFRYDKDGSGYELMNSGIGPAIVKWFKAEVNGQLQPDWKSAAKALGLSFPIENVHFINPVRGAVYLPGKPGHIFWIPQSPASDVLKENWKLAKLEICYCSIYDQCWYASNVVDERGVGLGSCDDAPASFFGHTALTIETREPKS